SRTRAARRAVWVPGIARRREVVGERRRGEAELVRGELAQDDGPGRSGARDQVRLTPRDVASEQLRARGRRSELVQIFEGDRDAMQRTAPGAACDLRLGRPCLRQRLVGEYHVIRAEARVQSLDAIEHLACQLE